MKIAIVGSGYVGLVASACLAALDHDVTCVDCDKSKIRLLRAGKSPIFEPQLDDLLVDGVRRRRLWFTTRLSGAVQGADVVFIAVGTPDNNGDGAPDLTNIFTVARDIAELIKGYCVVITKSTVPVGTGDAIEKILLAHAPAGSFDVVSNPEFLREGHAVADFTRPDRIVIGTESTRAREVMARLFEPKQFGAPVLFTSRRTAELSKYAANAFLAAKIAFINSIADVSERLGADVEEVSYSMGLDARIGPDFLQAGPGYGGSCLPKDTRALVETARQCGAPTGMLHAIVEANRKRKDDLARRVVAACGGSVAGRDIALLGLTFKPDTDDMRESPAIPLVEELHACGARVRGYDPAGMNNARRLLPMLKLSTDAYSCIQGAHAAVLVTHWPQFQNLDLRRVRSLLADPVFIDFRNAFDPRIMLGAGLNYVGIGRKLAGSEASGRIAEVTDLSASSSKAAGAFGSDPGVVKG